MSGRFQLVDVFGGERFKGNPVAVVTPYGDLSTDTMQDIARWLNLSETTFLLPPTVEGADYRVRIFTLNRELPFAGHPTLGTCHAWLESGGRPAGEYIIQQCEAGLVPIRRSNDRLAFAAPPTIRSGPATEDELQKAVQVLDIRRDAVVDAQWVDNGPGWLAVLLESADDVLAVQPLRAFPERADIGIVGPHTPGGDADWELRAIFSDQHNALIEDPVTGSLNASVAQWLIGSGRAGNSYVAAQGTAIGRKGRIFVDQDEARSTWIGGHTETLFTGETAF